MENFIPYSSLSRNPFSKFPNNSVILFIHSLSLASQNPIIVVLLTYCCGRLSPSYLFREGLQSELGIKKRAA